MKFNKKVLKNGLIILHEKRDIPVTTVMLAAKYGGIYEKGKNKGAAHFMEHLCFKGTEKRNTLQISSEIEKVGGILNAFTSEEVTAYHVKLPSEHTPLALDVIFDIFFNPIFPEGEVAKESNVICEEIKMRKDNPQVCVVDSIKGLLYKDPFGGDLIGKAEDVKAMTREILFKKHREIYHPKNSILCVVGNNSFEDVVNLAEKLVVERDGSEMEMFKLENHILTKHESRSGLNQTNLVLGVHFPYKNSSERAIAEVFSAILGEGMSSKLFTEVREKRGLVYGVKTYLDLGKNYGYLIIYAGMEPSKKEEVIKICLEEYSKMKDITQKELKDAKVQLIGNRHIEAEASDNVAINLILEEIYGDAKDYYSYEESVNAVILEDIIKLSKKEDFATFSLGP
tara:strand:- start:24107 stop:25297 length:1191 start_codon:yes stop_codon:yes gene_type:complete